MNGVVGSEGCCDQVLWLEYPFVAVTKVVDHHRIHVMDIDPTVDLVPIDSQIATIVTNDDMIPNLLPLARPVELLVDVAVPTKRGISNVSVEGEVAVALFEGFELEKLRIRPNPRHSRKLPT